ncbi:4Fe-4S dicluster domain-containing protein [Robiginitalea sp. IMCC44478]|uniref:4Fe-4S dicluster domain-containing protein n=1 Tax=Robiginitalea sp. IMCC44478 TaxID=3459122 RepID=UPI004042B6D7
MEEKTTNGRRDFLDKGLKAGILGAVAAGALKSLNACRDTNSEETIEVMSTDGTLIRVPSDMVEEVPGLKDDNYKVREGFPNRKFVMVVDLARCKNAKKCVSACNKSHFVTGENAWIKVYKMQDSPESSPYWQPTLCMHCDKPPCVKVCPVDATFKRRDGLVLIDNDRCIGCRFCMAACPYSTRVFNWEEPAQGETTEINLHLEHISHSPDYAGLPSQKGTVDKCDFCPHMIDQNELPHCVTACPNGVFFFGDAYEDTVTNGDETFRLTELLKEKAGYRMMENFGTEPSVYYLPPADRLVDFEEGLENYTPYKSVDKTE